jgi:hypothetical protein
MDGIIMIDKESIIVIFGSNNDAYLFRIGDTVEIIYHTIFDSSQRFWNTERQKGILVLGYSKKHCFSWFRKNKIQNMAYGSPLPISTRMVLVEKNLYKQNGKNDD